MQTISERLLITLWIGGMWMVGFVVTPTLFQLIDDRALAGTVAGQLFSITAYIGLVSGVLLLLNVLVYSSLRFYKNWRVWILMSMLILIGVGQFVITPMMTEIRTAGMLAVDKTQFDLLHRSASTLFMITSGGGLVLVIFGLRDKSEYSVSG